ncbi:MAG TPA: SRPBCC family protein [Gammaproteobacteria bacterium]|nr:SRPBCC family protein [Gammaproteobacteria bacterium]
MPVARLERTVAAPHDYCWAWLADFNALQFLHPPGNLTEFSCEGSHVGARRRARFKPEMGVEGQIVERLDVVHAPGVIVYSIVEQYPLPMRDYVAVVTMKAAGADRTHVVWEGHYTEHGLPAAQMDEMLRAFYTLFLDGIEKARALGKAPGQSPY